MPAEANLTGQQQKQTNEKEVETRFEMPTSLPFLSFPLSPFLKKIMEPRGPLSDLCVVVVTTSA
jgi:hypothetical protein